METLFIPSAHESDQHSHCLLLFVAYGYTKIQNLLTNVGQMSEARSLPRS